PNHEMAGKSIWFALVAVLGIRIARWVSADCDLTLSNASSSEVDSYFENKVVWITGASSGIGEGLAKRLSAAGATLVLSARRESELERVRSSLSYPSKAKILPLDLADLDSLPAKAEEA